MTPHTTHVPSSPSPRARPLSHGSGLTECVERLIAHGAIISIVNKAQKTCCELADGEHHPALAAMLELALVFAPADEVRPQVPRSLSILI